MTYEARHSKGLNYALIAGCVLVSLIGFTAAFMPSKSPTVTLLGWVMVGACFAAAFIFYRRAADQSPQARVDAGGIYSRRYSESPVPWERIASVHVLRAGIQRIARIELKNPPEKTIGINTTYYDQGITDLLAAVRHYRPDLAA